MRSRFGYNAHGHSMRRTDDAGGLSSPPLVPTITVKYIGRFIPPETDFVSIPFNGNGYAGSVPNPPNAPMTVSIIWDVLNGRWKATWNMTGDTFNNPTIALWHAAGTMAAVPLGGDANPAFAAGDLPIGPWTFESDSAGDALGGAYYMEVDTP